MSLRSFITLLRHIELYHQCFFTAMLYIFATSVWCFGTAFSLLPTLGVVFIWAGTYWLDLSSRLLAQFMSFLKRSPMIIVFAVLAPACLFLTVSPAYAADAWEVYTYGSGDFLANVFNGVAMLTNGGFIGGAVKFALLLVFLLFMAQFISPLIGAGGGGSGANSGAEAFLGIIRTALCAVIATFMISVPKTVAIVDRVSPQQSQVIGGVPILTAFIAHAVSTIGDAMGTEMETVFSLPNTLRFTNGGLALGAKYTSSLASEIYPPSYGLPGVSNSESYRITASLKDYYINCVFPHYSSGDETTVTALTNLSTTYDVLNALHDPVFANESKTIQTVYDDNNDGTYTGTCADAIQDIDIAWDDEYSAWINNIESQLSGNAGLTYLSDPGNPTNLGSGMLTADLFNEYFQRADPSVVLKTMALINLMRDTLPAYAAYYGSPGAEAYNITTKTATSGWLTAAKFFNTLVQTMRGIMEGLIYGFSAFLPVMFVLGGFKALGLFTRIAFWIQLWVPFYVFLNLYADTSMQNVMKNIAASYPDLANSGQIAVNMQSLNVLVQQSDLILGYVGSVVWMVPTLAWGIMQGSAIGVGRVVDTVVGAGGAQSTASGIGGQVLGQGNVNLGNRSIMNDNIHSSDWVTSRQQMDSGGAQFTGIQRLSAETFQSRDGIYARQGELAAGPAAMVKDKADNIGISPQDYILGSNTNDKVGPSSYSFSRDPSDGSVSLIKKETQDAGGNVISNGSGQVTLAHAAGLSSMDFRVNDQATRDKTIAHDQSEGDKFSQTFRESWGNAASGYTKYENQRTHDVSNGLANTKDSGLSNRESSSTSEKTGVSRDVKDTVGGREVTSGSMEAGGSLGYGKGAKPGEKGGKASVDAGLKGSFTSMHEDSSISSENVSAAHAREWLQGFDKHISTLESAKQTTEDSQHIAKLKGYSSEFHKALDYSDSAEKYYQRSESLKNSESIAHQEGRAIGVNEETAFLKDYAQQRFGKDDETSVRAAIGEINNMVANGQSAQVAALHANFLERTGGQPVMGSSLSVPLSMPEKGQVMLSQGEGLRENVMGNLVNSGELIGGVNGAIKGSVTAPGRKPDGTPLQGPQGSNYNNVVSVLKDVHADKDSDMGTRLMNYLTRSTPDTSAKGVVAELEGGKPRSKGSTTGQSGYGSDELPLP